MGAFLQTARKMGADKLMQRVTLWRRCVAAYESYDFAGFHICGYDYLAYPTDLKAIGLFKLFVVTNSRYELNMSYLHRSRIMAKMNGLNLPGFGTGAPKGSNLSNVVPLMRGILDECSDAAFSGQGSSFFTSDSFKHRCKYDDWTKARGELSKNIGMYWDNLTRIGLTLFCSPDGFGGVQGVHDNFSLSTNPLFTGRR